MKKLTTIMLTALMVLPALAVAVSAQEVDVRGAVTDLSASNFTWDNTNFAGFYYDIDKGLGNEQITFTPTGTDPASKTLSDQETNGLRAINYKTTAQPKNFKFKAWGQYYVIGFLAEKYFAAYDDKTVTQAMKDYKPAENVSFPALKTKNLNMMTNEQISKVLMDDNKELTITSANPLKLAEGYQLAVKSIDIDGNKAYLELTKNGQVVDSKVVQPSISGAKMSDQTYYYKVDLGDTKEIVQIAVHFKNAFRGSDTNIATVDGEFQISDTTTPLKTDKAYDKMTIKNVNPTDMTITMDNKDNQITLSKNKDTVLMQNIFIKTADQDVIDGDNPLRYYIYKKFTEPGTYEIRGSVTDLSKDSKTWDNTNFAGFYYDIDKGLGNEKITFTPTGTDPASKTLSDQETNGLRGINYLTTAQTKNFKFKAWGQYYVIGFLAEKYFAAYDGKTVTQAMKDYKPAENVSFPALKTKNLNMMTNEQISKVLMDDNKELTITSANPLKLAEGYQLAIKSVDVKGNKAYLELSKNGQVVDSKVVQPSIDGASMSDQTYYYKVDLGDTKEIVQIAVHFKNAFAGSDTSIATVDGEFQISDTTTPLKTSQSYDKMTIKNVNPTDMTITMDNKDNQITLSKNKNTVLMQNIFIKTADQDVIDGDHPLRYYIYKAATIEAANVTAPTPAAAAANVTAAQAAQTKATENVTKAQAAENVSKAAAATAAANATAPAAEKPANVTKPANATAPAAKQPGFEGIFAITGLAAVAYLVLGRKQ